MPRQLNSCPLRDPDQTSLDAANQASLVIATDCEPGIRRRQTSNGFAYRHDDGRRVSAKDRQRIERLAIPPAWTDVWICANERGHVQATGRDARGRKQYRYHERWRAARDETKYGKMARFGEALPSIRAAVDHDLRHPVLDRSKVLALVVAVLDETLIRVGNSEYVRANESYGLTTLRSDHAEVRGGSVRLRFRGKAGKELHVGIDNPRIARALSRTRELPGQELFQYLDKSGQPRVVESGDVNAYLRELSGAELTSKDFRTWGGSLAFALSLMQADGPPSDRTVSAAVKDAATVLGNTPAVCRRSYVHPGLIELYLVGALPTAWERARTSEPRRKHLEDDERIFLGVVRRLSSRGER